MSELNRVAEQFDELVEKLFFDYPVIPDRFMDLTTGQVVRSEDIYGKLK
jgi:hypothetical protein